MQGLQWISHSLSEGDWVLWPSAFLESRQGIDRNRDQSQIDLRKRSPTPGCACNSQGSIMESLAIPTWMVYRGKEILPS